MELTKNQIDQIVELQNSNYTERIGKVYNGWRVTSVEYDWGLHRQRWLLSCVNCGKVRLTHNGQDYVKGRVKNCGCLTALKRKEEMAKIKEKERLQKEEAKKIAKIQKEQLKEQERIEKEEANVGKTFGRWFVEERVPYQGYKVRCLGCGDIKITKHLDQICNNCDEFYTDGRTNWAYKGVVGRKYSYLTILGYEGRGKVKVKCDCGNEKIIKAQQLKHNKQKSCGSKECVFHKRQITKEGSWSFINKEIIKRDGNKCRLCGFDKVLDVHHIIERKNGGTDDPKNLITLCPNCHAMIHRNIIKLDDNLNIVDLGVKKTKKNKNGWTINGIFKSKTDWCKEYGVSYQLAYYRITFKGMTPLEALTTKKSI